MITECKAGGPFLNFRINKTLLLKNTVKEVLSKGSDFGNSCMVRCEARGPLDWLTAFLRRAMARRSLSSTARPTSPSPSMRAICARLSSAASSPTS